MRLKENMLRFLWLFLLLWIASSSKSQINLESGFQYTSIRDPELNAIIETHNDLFPDYKKSLSKPQGMVGALFGMRYRNQSLATHLTWSLNLQTLKSEGGDQSIDRRIGLNLQTLSLALIPMISEHVGVGIGVLGYRWGTKDLEEKTSLDKTYSLGHRFFVDIYLGSPNVSQLVIRPFTEFYYKPLEASQLAGNLGVSYQPPKKKWYLGISLILLNGPK